ncbi:hypothetical protein ACO0OE_002912 [Hanseniaspora uvarum]
MSENFEIDLVDIGENVKQVVTLQDDSQDLEVEDSEIIDLHKQSNYRIWKKNSKLLYDYINTNNLKWPSLSVNCLPYHNTLTNDRWYMISSYTSDQLPEDEKVILTQMPTLNIPRSDLSCFEMENMEFQVLKNLDLNSNSKDKNNKSKNKVNEATKNNNELIKEYKAQNLKNNIEIVFPSSEQCNRISINVNNPDLFATASTKYGNVYLYDKTKCTTINSSVKNLMPTNYLMHLSGCSEAESAEVNCLEWNNMKKAELASGLSNGLLQVWDLHKLYKKGKTTYTEPNAVSILDEHGINDLSYMHDHDSLIGLGCESKYLQLFDTRSQNIVMSTLNKDDQKNGINSIHFNPHNSNLLAVGCSDASGQINVHDIRNIHRPILTFNHSDLNVNEHISKDNSVSKVQWNPFNPNILMSAGMEDGLVKLWDILGENDYDPNLLFTHGGHMLGITDCSWDLFDPWTIASCSFDNSMHIWKPSKRIIQEYYK